ncbi:MerR family transcriptional regulator [Niallia taxi]|nr:MerR family transcriptional regulator [Niallia taxi]MDE5054162.1 MerR family transcriptional regulator [Niallia taxi]
MKGKEIFAIGEISAKSGISIRTLHYYDEIGLLKPEKHPISGHRIYKNQDIITLQKITSLKFLGYSLEKIANLLGEESFTVSLNDTLQLHLQVLEEEKEKVEQSIHAIKRVVSLMEMEAEIDSSVLFTLIHAIKTEPLQKEWMAKNELADIGEKLYQKTEKEIQNLDKTYIQLAKELKLLYGRPVKDPEVQKMITSYLEASFAFLGEDILENLAEVDLENINIDELEELTHSPFTEEEEKWLHEAIIYNMGLED